MDVKNDDNEKKEIDSFINFIGIRFNNTIILKRRSMRQV